MPEYTIKKQPLICVEKTERERDPEQRDQENMEDECEYTRSPAWEELVSVLTFSVCSEKNIRDSFVTTNTYSSSQIGAERMIDDGIA